MGFACTIRCRPFRPTITSDRSGWWQLISFVPFVGIIVMLVFLCQDSRPNRYGATPAYAV
jgi:uncharacterized membrane protein YhaH (DUF805 family)